jgi:hypothetical protein
VTREGENGGAKTERIRRSESATATGRQFLLSMASGTFFSQDFVKSEQCSDYPGADTHEYEDAHQGG